MSAFALHFHEPSPWVSVEVLPAAVAVTCSRCRGASWAYMTLVRKDPETVNRLIDEHKECEARP
jgi:hypothetical protein